MDNPVVVFVLGAACGVGIALFGLLTLWLHRQHRQNLDLWRYPGFTPDWTEVAVDGAWRGWAGFCCAALTFLAIVGAVDSTFALPHLEWVAGVLAGIGATLLVVRWLRDDTSKPA